MPPKKKKFAKKPRRTANNRKGQTANTGTRVAKKFHHLFQVRKASEHAECEVFPTGIPALDRDVLKIGGIPKGRIIEIYGMESGGKSTMALYLIAEAMRRSSNYSVWDDEEGCFVPRWPRQLGVDLDRLLVPDYAHGNEACDTCLNYIEAGGIDYFVVDSLAAMRPKVKFDLDSASESIDMNQYINATRAVMIGEFLEAAVSGSRERRKLKDSGMSVILVNQTRHKMNTRPGQNTEKTPGGDAAKFYASTRLRVSKIGTSKTKDRSGSPTHIQVKIECTKNKLGPPNGSAVLNLNYLRGFEDDPQVILDIGIEKGLLEQSGSWISSDTLINGKIQGIDAFGKFLAEYPEIRKEILS